MHNAEVLLISKDELNDFLTQIVKSTAKEPEEKEKFPPTKSPTIIGTEDLCELLNVSRVTLHKWRKLGLVPYYKVSRRVFFDLAKVFESLPQYDMSNVVSISRSLGSGRKNA